MSCTYLNNDNSDERNLICRYKENGSYKFTGVLVSALSEEQITEKRRRIFDEDKEDVKDFPANLQEQLSAATNKDAWKKIYFESIPFKIDIGGNFIPEPVVELTDFDIHLLTVDEVRIKYLDIYAYDVDKIDLFNRLKAAWNEAKEYIRTMADIIWAGKE